MKSWLVALFSLLLFIESAGALDTPIISGGTSLPSVSATNYSGFGNGLNWQATELNSRNVVPLAGTLKNFYARVETAPAAGKSWVFTLVKNGSDQTTTCTISDAGTTCNDITHNFSVSVGDTISVKSVPSGTPSSPVAVQFGFIYTSTSSGESPILGHTRSTALSNSTTQYGELQGGFAPNATLNLRDAPAPTAGTFDKLYVELAGTPGVLSGYTLTVLKNGSTTGVTCDVTDIATTCNDTTHTFTVVSGDTLAMQFSVQSGTPTARVARWSLRWRPDTPGETILLKNDAASPNASGSVRYSFPPGGSQGWNGTENTGYGLMPGTFTWKKWVIQLNNAPGGTTPQYMFKSRKNTADGTQTITIVGAATTGSDLSNTDSLVAGDIITAWSQSANSPASAISKWGWVLVDPNDVPTPTPTPTATVTPTATPTRTPTPTPTVTPLPANLPMLGIGS